MTSHRVDARKSNNRTERGNGYDLCIQAFISDLFEGPRNSRLRYVQVRRNRITKKSLERMRSGLADDSLFYVNGYLMPIATSLPT